MALVRKRRAKDTEYEAIKRPRNILSEDCQELQGLSIQQAEELDKGERAEDQEGEEPNYLPDKQEGEVPYCPPDSKQEEERLYYLSASKQVEEEPYPLLANDQEGVEPYSFPADNQEGVEPCSLTEDNQEEEEEPCYLKDCREVECYELLKVIEEGSFGIVYKAKEKETGEIVALKEVKIGRRGEFPIASLHEFNLLMKVKHPNVVEVKEMVVGHEWNEVYIVMEYVDHDINDLMEDMPQPFLQEEVKTLMIQLLRAVCHLHHNNIIHRDLNTSNLLLSKKGVLKVGDFGSAREYSLPLENRTPTAVTLWYRPPELLLGAKEYSTAIDMWSVGCIFAELLLKQPLFRGKSVIDQLNLIFKELGTPNERIWPGYSDLSLVEKVFFTEHPSSNLRKRFPFSLLTEIGFDLLTRLLTYNPRKRITALEALDHKYFEEPPKAVSPSMLTIVENKY